MPKLVEAWGFLDFAIGHAPLGAGIQKKMMIATPISQNLRMMLLDIFLLNITKHVVVHAFQCQNCRLLLELTCG